MSTIPPSTWFAAKQGDLDTLKRLIEVEGHSFDQVDAELKTPFYYGCTYDKPHVLQYLEGLYHSKNVTMPLDQKQWCIVSCLAKDVRLYLEGKSTLESIIASREKKARDDQLTVWDAAREGNTSRLRAWIKSDPDTSLAENMETGKSALYEASHASQLAATAIVRQFFEQNMPKFAFESELERCRDGIKSDAIRQILDGQMSMKDVMLLEKAVK